MLPVHDDMWILYKNKIPVDKVKIAIDIPRMNPLGVKYKRWWKEEKKKAIEGYWVEHDGLWKFVSGPLYFFVNFWKILLTPKNSKTTNKRLGIPFLRDLEWIKSFVYEEARGFSGFTEDDEFSCHRLLAMVDPNIEPDRFEEFLMEYGNPDLIRSSLVNKKGEYKKYVSARDYLRLYFKRNLGKPHYFNMKSNVVDMESRGGGKSYWKACILAHNFIFDGASDYDDYLELKGLGEPLSSESLIGAIDTKYTNDLISKMKLGLENLPGKVTIGEVAYPSPFHRRYYGSWESGKTVTAGYDKKIGGVWEKIGTKSKIQHRSFNDNHKSANGTRPNVSVIDEVGFMYNLVQVLGQMKEAAADGTVKSGIIWMTGTGGDMAGGACVCAGTKLFKSDGSVINVEDVTKKDTILGYDVLNKSISIENIPWVQKPSKKECIKIITNTGRELKCSIDHPILYSKWSNFRSSIQVGKTINGKRIRQYFKKTEFTKACNLVVGNQVALPNKIDVWGTIKNKDSWLLGLLVGDGSYGSKTNGVTLSNCDIDINNRVKGNYSITKTGGYTTKDLQEYEELYIKGAKEILVHAGINEQSKLNKKSPIDLFTWDKETVCNYIAGYFDADGSVVNHRIEVTSICKNLLDDVQVILNKLGIHGSIRLKKKAHKKFINGKECNINDIYVLDIKDKDSILTFRENITLTSSKKQNRLDNCLTHYEDIISLRAKNLQDLRFERITSIESIGYQYIYNLEAGITHTYLANGIITHNTEEVKQVFYSPEAFDCLSFDDEFEGYQTKIGFFVPAWMTLNQFKDDFGNTNWRLAISYLNRTREKLKANVKKKEAYEDEIVQRPLVHSEVFLLINSSLMPVTDLKEHMDNMLALQNEPGIKGSNGWMLLDGAGNPYFKLDPDNYKPTDYPVKPTDDNEGAVVIWDFPVDGAEYGWYCAGNDPYDFDIAPNSVSLGSVLIFQRGSIYNGGYDRIVAEYTGRPKMAEDFYEQVRRLLMFYGGAICLYENEKQFIKEHFKKMYSIGLLAFTPGVLKANENSKTAKVRLYGQHMSTQVKAEAEIYGREWLLTPIGDGKMQLHTIKSIPLLKELISYNPAGNFDRVIAFLLGVIQLIQMRTIIIEEATAQVEEEEGDDFFSRKHFITNRRT